MELRTDAVGLPQCIRLSPEGSDPEAYQDDRNWMTVLLGENGTRKSLILRLLAGAALGKPRFSSPGHKAARSTVILDRDEAVPKVIAISCTPNDRFPVSAGVPLYRRPTSFDMDEYAYFGPRHNMSGSGSQRQLSTLAHSLLGDISSTFQRRSAIGELLSFMGFTPSLHLTLVPVRREGASYADRVTVSSRRHKEVAARAENIDTWLASEPSTWGSMLRGYVASLLEDGHSRDMAVHLSSKTHRIELRFDKDIFEKFIDLDDAWNSGDISHLVAIGLLRVDSLRVRVETTLTDDLSSSKGVASEDLSSGQWQLLNSLINLALKVSSDSVILIDEPENSLHPEWQRDYIKMLGAALGGATGCHTIIATHSPLIAAGVDSRSGNILAAKRMAIDRSIEIEEVGSVYAWRPDDVLREKFDMDTARAPELEDVANRLLSIVGGTSDVPAQPGERQGLARRLQVLAGNLPPDDPLVPALRALSKLGLAEAHQVLG